ncbi:MAG: RP853 family protein [Pseudomonadota bacterium]
MNTDLSLPPGVDPTPFKEYFLEYLGANLSESLCSSVANLLAIDYVGRLESKPDLDFHINECTLRIKKQLGLKVVTDESFSSVMTLFTIAITPERDLDTDDEKTQEQSHDALIDSIIATYFHDLTPEETAIIKSLMKEILNGKDGKEMMIVASSNPKLFYSIVVSAIREKNKLEEVLESVKLHLTQVMSKNKQQVKQQSGLKSLVSKLSLIGGLMLTASTGLVLGGLALPALILPATAAVVKLSPKLGEKAASSQEQEVVSIQKKESKDKINTLHATDKDSRITQSTEKNIEQKVDKAKIKDLAQSISISKKSEKTVENKFEKKLQTKIKSKDKGRSI